MRNFEIRYYRYERHNTVPAVVFRKKAFNLVDAFKKLPLAVQQDVLQCWDSEDPVESFREELRTYGHELTDESLAFQLDNIDTGGDSFLIVSEEIDGKRVHVCGIDDMWSEEAEDQEW